MNNEYCVQMLSPPSVLWRTEPGSLYTLLLVNADIERSLQARTLLLYYKCRIVRFDFLDVLSKEKSRPPMFKGTTRGEREGVDRIKQIYTK